MIYIILASIVFVSINEYRCCGPAGTTENSCNEWNKVSYTGNFAEKLTTIAKPPGFFDGVSTFFTQELFKKKYNLLKYYVSFGVDLMQLNAYEMINNDLLKDQSKSLYILYAEASYVVSKYYYRQYNYKKGLLFINEAIHKIEHLPGEDFTSYELSMWLAYLRDSQIQIVQELENYHESISYIDGRRNENYQKAVELYEHYLSEPNSKLDGNMEFLIGKELLKSVDAHLPLALHYSLESITDNIDKGIKSLRNYDTLPEANNLIESRFILGNIEMKIGKKAEAKKWFLKAIKSPVKNSQDRAINYEVKKTFERFYSDFWPTSERYSDYENQVFSRLDTKIIKNYSNFWPSLLKKENFNPQAIYDFVRTVTLYNSMYINEQNPNSATEDLINEGISALKKIEHLAPSRDYYKWLTVLSGAKCYNASKSRANLELRTNLKNAILLDSDNTDPHLTYLYGKYVCQTSLNPDGTDIVSNVGWNFKSEKKEQNKYLNSCIKQMEKLDNVVSPYINVIDKNKLLAEAYWNKNQHEKAINLLEKTIFITSVVSAEDRWYNFLVQELLGHYQAEKFNERRHINPAKSIHQINLSTPI
ncbi:uncharacterized protein LOC126897825 isoform X2 [Daktulosphaira vitifoliae]|uniref:uncharacterized protein LOC126897825 isoform X2 n=1 Tax=Daktulosphaira vitifoliae TaxID=58002 RepID=UPI0021AA69EF|nr:uncharacterized protein LOC126897825 isoform X2 [Daktulosphaira vitifoliae]